MRVDNTVVSGAIRLVQIFVFGNREESPSGRAVQIML
jgi:hypothetical protein